MVCCAAKIACVSFSIVSRDLNYRWGEMNRIQLSDQGATWEQSPQEMIKVEIRKINSENITHQLSPADLSAKSIERGLVH